MWANERTTDKPVEAGDTITIDSNNANVLQKLWDRGEFDKVFNSVTHWTRITIILGGQYEKDLVLRTIMHSAPTPDVFPALYQIDGNDSFFLVRNCSTFVRKLSINGLRVTHQSGKYKFDISITANYLSFAVEPLNVYQQIKIALTKRSNRKLKTVDLTNFSQDECLQDIFFHLNIPQCMHYLLDLPRKIMGLNFSTLILQHNDLRTLKSLDLQMLPISELDLRYNNITWEGFETLQIKRGMKLNVVWLDGNPLCINLSESEFIKRVDAVIPYVKKVDGIDVSNIFCGHSSVRNFIYDASWATFTDHFLHHYFGLMEGPNRHQLARMYHQKATLSISVYHDPEDIPNWSKLSNYSSYSRNLLTLSDITKAYSTLNVGPDEIVNVLNSLPVMQFDPYSFTVDVPISQVNGLALIDVGGIFQELNSGLFYFHRSFLLTPFKKNVGEWKIETDMLTISPATPDQITKSFSAVRRRPSPKMQLKLNPRLKDKDALIPAVCELTKLTKEYAVRFLEEGSWDLEVTLQAFVDQLKGNQVPMHAFVI